MIKEALIKIQTELGANANNRYIQVVGGFLMNHVRDNPQDAEKILTDGKTVAGSLEAMKMEAKKNQSNGVGVLTDEHAFRIVLAYFGIKVPEAVPAGALAVKPGLSVQLDDLL